MSEGIKATTKHLPTLIICEGYEDYAFLTRLIQSLDLPKCNIVMAGGKDKIGAAIDKVRIDKTKMWANLKDVIIVGDNDNDPNASFKSICDQLDVVFGPKAAPHSVLVASITKPRCIVVMVPWTDVLGNLECLCCDSARRPDKEKAKAVDTFMALIHANKWADEARYGKAWLRINLAIRCKDPFVALGDAFAEPKYQELFEISLKDKYIKQLADLLSKCGV